MNNNKIVESKLKEKYQDFLSNFLTLPIDDSFIGISKSDQFPTRLDPKDITDSHRRKILANEIFNFKKQLSGQHATQLSNYFFGLGLQKEVIDLINSYSWTDQVRGMQLTNEFQIVEGLTHINKYINHKNSEIAIHTLVTRLSFDKSIVVLNEIERKLTAWEWHKIVHEIEKLKISNVDFKTLIAAKKQDYKLIQIAEQRLNPSPARVQIPTL